MSVEGFAAVPNWMIRDESVSLYAVLVYAALASHTGRGGVRPSQRRLAAEARCSERRVRDAIAELQALGVVEVVRRRRTGDGRSTTLSNGYVLHPHGALGSDEEPVELPAPDAGTSGSYRQEMTKLPAPDDISDLYIEEEPVKKNPASEFDRFWMVYPRRVGKTAALKAFEKAARAVGADVVMAGALRFAADPNLPEAQFVPHPATWLNQGRWDDDPLPVRGEGSSSWVSSVPVGEEWMLR